MSKYGPLAIYPPPPRPSSHTLTPPPPLPPPFPPPPPSAPPWGPHQWLLLLARQAPPCEIASYNFTKLWSGRGEGGAGRGGRGGGGEKTPDFEEKTESETSCAGFWGCCRLLPLLLAGPCTRYCWQGGAAGAARPLEGPDSHPQSLVWHRQSGTSHTRETLSSSQTCRLGQGWGLPLCPCTLPV